MMTRKLISVFVSVFKRWYTELLEEEKDHKGALKEHQIKIISKHTYSDLTRSIREFMGLVAYLHINHRDTIIVPRTTNKDEVENCFSLQRNRIAGGEPTVQQQMEVNSSITTSLLIQQRHNNILTDAFNFVPQDKELTTGWEELFTHVYQDPDAKYQGGEI